MMFDVVGLGCCCFDLLGVVPHLPGPMRRSACLRPGSREAARWPPPLVTLARWGARWPAPARLVTTPSATLSAGSWTNTGSTSNTSCRSRRPFPGLGRAGGSGLRAAQHPGLRAHLLRVAASQLPPGLIEQAQGPASGRRSPRGRAGSCRAGPPGRGAGGAGCRCSGPGRRHLRAAAADRHPDCLAGLCQLFCQYRRRGPGHRPPPGLRSFGGAGHPGGAGAAAGRPRGAGFTFPPFRWRWWIPPGRAMSSTAPLSTGCCSGGS